MTAGVCPLRLVRRDEAKKGKGGGAVIRTVKSDSISWMALRSGTQLLSLFTHARIAGAQIVRC